MITRNNVSVPRPLEEIEHLQCECTHLLRYDAQYIFYALILLSSMLPTTVISQFSHFHKYINNIIFLCYTTCLNSLHSWGRARAIGLH